MNRNKLGFGCMHLPVCGHDQSKIRIEEMARMADIFLDRGGTYFDTSFFYHGGHAEEAFRAAVVNRHQRSAFTIAAKFPAAAAEAQKDAKTVLCEQLARLGTRTIDYLALPVLQTPYAGGPGAEEHLDLLRDFERWKREGRLAHIGITLHDTHDVLDRILTEHSEIDFVQIAVNYLDWDSLWIQSATNLETIRRHGKTAVVMEPTKHGLLENLPPACLTRLHSLDPQVSPAVWAVRFAASEPDVEAVIVNMQKPDEVLEIADALKDSDPFSEDERSALHDCAQILRSGGILGDMDRSSLAGCRYHGLPADAVIEAYDVLSLYEHPETAEENIYLRQELLKVEAGPPEQEWPDESVIVDGRDITAELQTAWATLRTYAF